MYILKKNVKGVLTDVGRLDGDYEKATATMKSAIPRMKFLGTHTVEIADEMYELVEVPLLATTADFQDALGFHETAAV